MSNELPTTIADTPSGLDFHQAQTPTSAPKGVENIPSIFHRRKKLILISVLCTFCFVLGLSLYYIYDKYIDNDSVKILQNFEATSAIQITFNSKRGTLNTGLNGTQYDAYIITTRDEQNKLIIDGRISFEENGNIFNYTVVNDRGYFSVEGADTGELVQSGCLDPAQIPPLHTLEDSLRNARVIDYADDGLIECSNGKLIELEFAGEPYVFCSPPGVHDPLKAIVGEDLDAQLKYLGEDDVGDFVDLLPPTKLTGEKLICPSVDISSRNQNVHFHSRLLASIHQHAKLWHGATLGPARRSLASATSKCKCKSKRRPCLFVHGVGSKTEAPVQTEPYMFGDIAKRAPCCSSIQYVHFRTIDDIWHGNVLQKKLCKAALEIDGSKPGDTTIDDTIIITHSMGGLVMSQALASATCTLAKSSTWVTLQAPMRGSRSVNFVRKNCASGDHLIEKIAEGILRLIGQCPTEDAYIEMSYDKTPYCTPSLAEKYAAAENAYRKYVSAALCGYNAFGLPSLDSLGMQLVDTLSGHVTKNDGVVELDSCASPLGRTFKRTYSNNKFYEAAVNHMDGAFKHGDGWWGADRKPVKWFECLL